ncbi:MAG: molybdopterin-synthase adenylyltransferase MoeB [Desulfovibrionaceae bacterium]|nr:molybdopterin-synthase adenylyltransferase MoeB [Desulfovibrionaceae bacterium]
MAELSDDEMIRYSRHLVMPEIGPPGQQKLKAARVLIVGAGGLGSALGLYLAAAGVGVIGLVDDDAVEASNLQRQVIHSSSSLGRLKTSSARERIQGINPWARVPEFSVRLSRANVLEIFRDFDIIADASDNFATRYLINDACVLLGKPEVYGAVLRFEGQTGVFDAGRGSCLRCLYPEPPEAGEIPSGGEAGVLAVLPGIVGCIQANETIKLILGSGRALIDRLLGFDAWAMRFHEFRLRKDPGCPLCGEHPRIREV